MMISMPRFLAPGRTALSRSVQDPRILLQATRFTSTKSDAGTKTESKMSWYRGYLGVGASTERPDATFMAVATVVGGAGFYAWFIDPPKQS